MKDILKEGEISFLFFGNEFSHAVVKTSKEGEFRIQEEHGGSVCRYYPSEEELSKVSKILSYIKHDWSYARVDVVRDKDALFLMELEVIEPELFLRFSDKGESLFAESIYQNIKINS